MRQLTTLLFVLAVAATSGGATDCGEIIADPGFDVWCGDDLCRWRLEKGEVARAPTWHEADNGVALVGAEVAISQITTVDSSDGTCVEFSLVADIAAEAEVRLQLDVYGDGSIEFDERLPTADWRPLAYRVRMPAFYQGVRFRLTKLGGHAVLANIGAAIVAPGLCPGPALVVGKRALGITCTAASDCASGVCAPGFFSDTCAECLDDGACTGGEVCGLAAVAESHQTPWPACEAPASAATGTPCRQDAECGTGICANGACGLCRTAGDCGGAACEQIAYSAAQADAAPFMVEGGRHCVTAGTDTGTALVGSGGACLDDSDCASGTCAGELLKACRTAFGLRECTTDMECPVDFGANPTCVTVGTRGGTCQ